MTESEKAPRSTAGLALLMTLRVKNCIAAPTYAPRTFQEAFFAAVMANINQECLHPLVGTLETYGADRRSQRWKKKKEALGESETHWLK